MLYLPVRGTIAPSTVPHPQAGYRPTYPPGPLPGREGGEDGLHLRPNHESEC